MLVLSILCVRVELGAILANRLPCRLAIIDATVTTGALVWISAFYISSHSSTPDCPCAFQVSFRSVRVFGERHLPGAASSSSPRRSASDDNAVDAALRSLGASRYIIETSKAIASAADLSPSCKKGRRQPVVPVGLLTADNTTAFLVTKVGTGR